MTTKTRQTRLIYLLSSMLLSITACSTRIQITEYPTHLESKLAELSSYCWADDISKENALEKLVPTSGHHIAFDPTVRSTINAALNEKGYQQVPCSSADYMIDYRMGLHEDVAAVDATYGNSEINAYGPRWRIGDDNSVDYEGLAKPEEQIITVRHGTLHIAAFMPDNRVLWHSAAEKTLREQDSDEARKANISKAVREMMDNFPQKH